MISKDRQASKKRHISPEADSMEKRRRLGNIFYAIQLNLMPDNKERLKTFFKYQAQSNNK